MERVYLKDLGLQYNYSELENRNKTDMIVIHHTGNPTDDDLSAKEINASHQSQAWTCIGYHYVILDILPMPKGRGFLDTNDTCLLK